MTAAGVVSLAALAVVAALCLCGVWAHVMRDNLFERIGMGLVCIGCCGRVVEILATGDAPPGGVIVSVGLLCFAVGAAWAKWRLWRAQHRTPEAAP